MLLNHSAILKFSTSPNNIGLAIIKTLLLKVVFKNPYLY